MNFNEILKDTRKERGISQKKLSEISGLSPQCISAFETGINSPTSISLIALANALNVSVDYLLGRTDELGAVLTSPAPQLPADEHEVLSLFRSLSPSRKTDLLIYLRALSGTSATVAKKKA